MKIIKFSAPIAVLALGLVAAQPASSTTAASNPQGGVPRDDIGGGMRAETLIGLVGDAASLNSADYDWGTETCISIYNDTPEDRVVRVEWLYDTGGAYNATGVSGPLTIGPGESWEFSTANEGETHWPMFNNASRDTTNNFVGRARIYSDPGGFRGIAMQAYRLVGIGTGVDGSAETLTEINVYKIKASGARQAGD